MDSTHCRSTENTHTHTKRHTHTRACQPTVLRKFTSSCARKAPSGDCDAPRECTGAPEAASATLCPASLCFAVARMILCIPLSAHCPIPCAGEVEGAGEKMARAYACTHMLGAQQWLLREGPSSSFSSLCRVTTSWH